MFPSGETIPAVKKNLSMSMVVCSLQLYIKD